MKNAVFLQPARRYRATDILDGCKPLKMGAIRKPRFSDCDVEKTMDGFFNNLLVPVTETASHNAASEPDQAFNHQAIMTEPFVHLHLHTENLSSSLPAKFLADSDDDRFSLIRLAEY